MVSKIIIGGMILVASLPVQAAMQQAHVLQGGQASTALVADLVPDLSARAVQREFTISRRREVGDEIIVIVTTLKNNRTGKEISEFKDFILTKQNGKTKAAHVADSLGKGDKDIEEVFSNARTKYFETVTKQHLNATELESYDFDRSDLEESAAEERKRLLREQSNNTFAEDIAQQVQSWCVVQ